MHALGFELHHVGYAVQEIGPLAEKYSTRFGYTFATEVIHDPIQTAFVQFLKLPRDLSYLEFVAPDSPESKLAGALKRGGGLNHLCYICGPIEQAIAHLEAEGLLLISAPAPAVAFAGRRICWLYGNGLPVELVERRHPEDLCAPGL